MILVRGLGGELQFLIHLIEQVLGLRSVPVHVPLVRLLRRSDLLPSLLWKSLRRRQIRMLLAADILDRLLGHDHAATDQCRAEGGTQDNSSFAPTRDSPF